MGHRELCVESRHLLKRIVPFLVLNGGLVGLLLLAEAKEEDVLGEDIDWLLAALDEADGRPLVLLREMELRRATSEAKGNGVLVD